MNRKSLNFNKIYQPEQKRTLADKNLNKEGNKGQPKRELADIQNDIKKHKIVNDDHKPIIDQKSAPNLEQHELEQQNELKKNQKTNHKIGQFKIQKQYKTDDQLSIDQNICNQYCHNFKDNFKDNLWNIYSNSLPAQNNDGLILVKDGINNIFSTTTLDKMLNQSLVSDKILVSTKENINTPEVGDILIEAKQNLVLDSCHYLNLHPQDGLYISSLNPETASNELNISGAGIRMMFIPGLGGAIRAGQVTGAQWDQIGVSSSGFGINANSSGPGAFASGAAFTDGSIQAGATGAHAFGTSTNGGIINSYGRGSIAFGNTNDGGIISSSGVGSLAYGYAPDEGCIIQADRSGASATGYSSLGGRITSSGLGSSVKGYAYEGLLYAVARGSSVSGFVRGSDDRCRILTDAWGSHIFGRDLEMQRSKYSILLGQHGQSRDYDGSLQIAGGSVSGELDGISAIIYTETYGSSPIGGGNASFWNSNGADYAEYFEWNDVNNLQERIGYFVELVGNKIKISNNSSTVIGITTANNAMCGYVADCAELHWHKANLRDKFGRILTKTDYKTPLLNLLENYEIEPTTEITQILDDNWDDRGVIDTILSYDLNNIFPNVQNLEQLINDIKLLKPLVLAQVNPEYKPELIYEPRCNRKEWSPVAILGKVYVRDNGLCQVGNRCDCNNGIAVPGNTWRVMERVDTDVIRIFLIPN